MEKPNKTYYKHLLNFIPKFNQEGGGVNRFHIVPKFKFTIVLSYIRGRGHMAFNPVFFLVKRIKGNRKNADGVYLDSVLSVDN